MFANRNLSGKGKIHNTLRSHIIQHIPRSIFVRETTFDINVGNTSSATFLIKQRTELAFLLNCARLHQRNPLIGINKILILLIQQIISRTHYTSAILSRDKLKVEAKVARETIFDFVDSVKNLCGKLNRFVRIRLITKFVGINQAKHIHDFIHTDTANCTELLIKFNSAILIIGQKPLFNVAL